MQFFLLIVLLFASSVAALTSDSGIFDDNNNVKTAQAIGSVPTPATAERRLARGTPIKRDTNAARMRRGLSPLPPTRRAPGHLRPRASPTPCDVRMSGGTIEVHAAVDGSLLGYIGQQLDSQGSYTLQNSGQPFVLGDYSNTFDTSIEFAAGYDASPANLLLGAVGGSGGYTFGSGQLGYAYLAAVSHTDANSPPSSSAQTSMQTLGYNGPSESQIWTVSCALDITAQWTNPDGGQPATTIFYDPQVDYLGVTGDLDTFNNVFGENAVAVTFKWSEGLRR